jgi:hypothetical protein
MKINERDESFLSRIKREENETLQLRYRSPFKISTDSDIVRLMIFTISLISWKVDSDIIISQYFLDHFQKIIIQKNFIIQLFSYRNNYNLYVHDINMLTLVANKDPAV